MKISRYIEQALLTFGLSEGEATVYHQLLDKPRTIQELKEKTRYSTAGLYKIVGALVERGFVEEVLSSYPLTFNAIPLGKLSSKFAAQGRKMARISDRFKDLGKLAKIPYETEIYEGNDMTDYYLNIPSKIDDLIWCVGSFEAVMKFFGPAVEKDFVKSRLRRLVHADAIIFDDSAGSKELARRDVLEKRETKLITCKNYPLEFSYLFGTTLLNFYKDTEGKIKVLKIDSPEYARAKIMQYQLLKNSTM